MRMTSTAFANGAAIPHRYTCDGDDVSPPLEWSGAPIGTCSFVLRNDPDAPAGTWHHWAAFDILPDQKGLPEGAAQYPEKQNFKQAINDFQQIGYGHPCMDRITITSSCLRFRYFGCG